VRGAQDYGNHHFHLLGIQAGNWQAGNVLQRSQAKGL